jgi:hypothetical protein
MQQIVAAVWLESGRRRRVVPRGLVESGRVTRRPEVGQSGQLNAKRRSRRFACGGGAVGTEPVGETYVMTYFPLWPDGSMLGGLQHRAGQET